MKSTIFRASLASLGLAAALALSPAAFAQTSSQGQESSGVTSGPATSTPTMPNTALSKQQGGTHGMSQAGEASVGVGAPGVPAKKGTEAGESPKAGGPGGESSGSSHQ